MDITLSSSEGSSSSEEPVLSHALQIDLQHLNDQQDWPNCAEVTATAANAASQGASAQSTQGVNRTAPGPFPTRGRLPTDVTRALNTAWTAAGSQIPGEEAIAELCLRFGAVNIARIRRFFADKERRTRRQRELESGSIGHRPLDVERLAKLERFLFPSPDVDENCPTALCGLQHVLRLESAAGLLDVGHDVYMILRCPAGLRSVRSYQYAYWVVMRSQMLATSALSAAAAKLGAECVEIRLRLEFSEAHARYCFGAISAAIATRRSNPAAQYVLASSIGRRQVSAVNERVRLFLRDEMHMN